MFKRTIAMSALIAGIGLAGSALASPEDEVTFAQWRSTNSQNDVVWTKSGTSGALTLTQAALKVDFSNLLPALVPFLTDVPALLTLTDVAETGNAADSSVTSHHTFLDQGGIAGSYEFTNLDPITIDGHTFAAGSNLLSAQFGNADITGFKGAAAASLLGSTDTGSLTYASDFMSFPVGAASDFSWAFSSVTPGLGVTAGKALNTFRGSGAGTFAADAPDPIVAPEPTSWAIMLLSSAVLGARLRRPKPRLA